MEHTMSWTELSKMEWLRLIETIVLDAFTAFRGRGHRRDHAIEMTAAVDEVAGGLPVLKKRGPKRKAAPVHAAPVSGEGE